MNIQSLRNAKMSAKARYKLYKMKREAQWNAPDVERTARLSAAVTPPEVWAEMPPDKLQRTLEILGGSHEQR